MVSIKGKSNTSMNRVEDHATRKSVGVRNFKVSLENDKVKVRNRDSITTERNGTSRESPLLPRRKSVSFNKRVTQSNASNSKRGLKTSENSKAKRDGSFKINVGRKVLADVSNLRGNFLRNVVSDGSKSVVLTDSGTRNASSSSSHHVMGKARANASKVVSGNRTLKRVETKDLKVYVDDLKGKGHDCGSVNTYGRITIRNPLPPTRKSLPVSKRVGPAAMSHKKETAEKLEKDNRNYRFAAKVKVGAKIMPNASNASSHLWRNRVSDGFINMAPKIQSEVEAQSASRKLVKPIVKTTHRVSSTKMTLKSNCTSSVNKSTSVAAISCKRKDKTLTSLSKKSASIATQEHPTQEFPSDCNSNSTTKVSVNFTTRKPHRRKSFTSLLMEKSKLLEHGGVMKQENLPNVYDDCNHLEVTEYVDEIYQYYWVMEAQNHSLVNYMAMQTEITPQLRGILVNWLIEVHLKFDLMQETLYLTVTLLDQFLSLVTIKRNEMQLVGLTALLLASKYEDFWHPRVLELLSLSPETYTKDQMLGMERAILKKLKFRLNAPTPYMFMLRFLKAAESDTKLEHLAFYLIEMCLVEYEALKFKPSLLCASAVYVARCTLKVTPAWTPLLANYARYQECQIRECAEMILKFHKAAKTAILKVTYEKYTSSDRSGVATIKPLDRLPLPLRFE